MARHHNAEGKQRNNINRRLSALEREVRAKSPIPPEEAANMAAARQAGPGEKMDFMRVTPGNAQYSGPVREHLARLGGRSDSGLADDRTRGSGSPIPGKRRR